MDYITLYVVYGSHTDCFTLTRNTTWSDLCTLIQDRSGLPVTRLYHHHINGNIKALSCDDDLKSLVYGCNTSWLRLSIDLNKTISLLCGDNISIQQDVNIMQNGTSSQHDKTCYTTQFESFGKLMDKYNDLIQSDGVLKTMMHDIAIRLTLQQNLTVDLAEIEARLEKRLGNTITGTNNSRSAIIDEDNSITTNDQISLAFYQMNAPGSSRSTTTSSAAIPLPLNDHVKRSPTTPSRSHDTFDHSRTVSSPSYKPRQTVKGTIVGEWPAYSSLYPPPPHSMPTRYDSSPSLSLSLLDSDTLDHYNHHHHQKSPLSLYPQPPIMTATQSDRTRRSITNRASSSPSPRPSSFSAGMPLKSTMKSNTISDRPLTSYSNNSIINNSSSSINRLVDWNHDDSNQYKTEDSWQTKRQSYKEQHRALKSQQKELERTIRHLKRQEKLDKKEYRKTLQQYDNNNNALIRKSSSLSSLSSSTSASSSALSSDPCLQQQQQHQNDWDIACYVPSSSSSIDQQPSYSDINVSDDQYHYGSDRKYRQIGIDKTSSSLSSQDHGGGVTYLASTLDRLSMNQPHASPVV